MRPFVFIPYFVLLLLAVLFLVGCNTTSGKMHQQIGSTHYRNGQLQQAKEEFHRALADDPQNATHAHNLATTMKKQGNMVAAEQMFRRAITIDPNHQPAYHGLVKMMNAQGRSKEAVSLLNNWQQSNTASAAPYVEMAALQRETNDIAGAEQSLKTALKKQPNHPIAISNLGLLYEQTGRVNEAKIMYQRSLSSNMKQPEVYRRLAAIQQIPTGRIINIIPNNRTAQMSIAPVPLKVIPLPPYEQPLPWSAALRQQPSAIPLYQTFPAQSVPAAK